MNKLFQTVFSFGAGQGIPVPRLKTLLLTLCLCALPTGLLAQGTVIFANSLGTKVSTNGFPWQGSTGVTSATAGGFKYALFTAPSTATSATVQDLISGSWTFTGLYATNTLLASGGRLNGGSNVPVTGWTPGETNAFVIFGWSTSAGQTWPQIAAEMNGAFLVGGGWVGPETPLNACFGLSPIGYASAGGGPQGLPPCLLFGQPNGQGAPIGTGFILYPVVIPEPSPAALCTIGTLAFACRFVEAIRRFRAQASR